MSQKFREIDFTKKAHGQHFGGINPITENEDNNHALWDIFLKYFDSNHLMNFLKYYKILVLFFLFYKKKFFVC